jgi:hypothetical protein
MEGWRDGQTVGEKWRDSETIHLSPASQRPGCFPSVPGLNPRSGCSPHPAPHSCCIPSRQARRCSTVRRYDNYPRRLPPPFALFSAGFQQTWQLTPHGPRHFKVPSQKTWNKAGSLVEPEPRSTVLKTSAFWSPTAAVLPTPS